MKKTSRLTLSMLGAGMVVVALGGVGWHRAEAAESTFVDSTLAPAPFSCPTVRTTSDRVDGTTDYKVKILYVVPSDGVDRALDTTGALCRSARDLMYAARPGTSDPGWDIYSGAVVLDSGRDQYYGHSGSQLDLDQSAFLSPLPPGALAPPGW
ncbi:hypothetical protein HUW62_04755 [Myxococcus sp. AM011]|uniref:hypothetical protein n=1 Tax=Myxococcus sp. AM011 TaxID=2745200 RepID=UPI00159620FE|nr:hypothetical protein [Myxococcus sp. AM011]NVJ20533.1 hypothetical protein [Myxococcus sp. AM011]